MTFNVETKVMKIFNYDKENSHMWFLSLEYSHMRSEGVNFYKLLIKEKRTNKPFDCSPPILSPVELGLSR